MGSSASLLFSSVFFSDFSSVFEGFLDGWPSTTVAFSSTLLGCDMIERIQSAVLVGRANVVGRKEERVGQVKECGEFLNVVSRNCDFELETRRRGWKAVISSNVDCDMSDVGGRPPHRRHINVNSSQKSGTGNLRSLESASGYVSLCLVVPWL